MIYERLNLVEQLVESIPDLTLGQLHWIHRVVAVFGAEHKFAITQSDLFDEIVLRNFGDADNPKRGTTAGSRLLRLKPCSLRSIQDLAPFGGPHAVAVFLLIEALL